jgi:hypothetical protein
MRFPIGYFRVSKYIRGKKGINEAVIELAAVICFIMRKN